MRKPARRRVRLPAMLEILQRLLSLDWRRHGAAIRELEVLGSRVWYAEFEPHKEQGGGPPPGRSRDWAPGAPARGVRRRSARRHPPTVILLHGLGAAATSFYPIVPQLRSGYRVVVPDLPGYGQSRLPKGREFLTFSELLDVAERFAARVAPRGAYVAGNSMGGWIATKLAARRPDLVHGIALLNPGGAALRAEDWLDFTQFVLSDRMPMNQYFQRVFHRPPFGVHLFARDLRRIMRGPAVTQLLQTLTFDDFLTDQEMGAIRCPSVLIWGENDRLIPKACREYFREKLPRLKYVPMPDCGHCPQLECPRRTAEILLELPKQGASVVAA